MGRSDAAPERKPTYRLDLVNPDLETQAGVQGKSPLLQRLEVTRLTGLVDSIQDWLEKRAPESPTLSQRFDPDHPEIPMGSINDLLMPHVDRLIHGAETAPHRGPKKLFTPVHP